MQRIVEPAIQDFKPDLIIVACGFDANAVDPLARQLLYSESYRAMTRLMMDTAGRLCDGKLALALVR